MVLNLFLILLSFQVFSFELISHKGVHQEIEIRRPVKLDPQGCPTRAMIWRNHFFIENTIPAIAEAFRLGADRVEIDLTFSQDKRIVLMHDSHLLCRSGMNAATSSLTLAELKRLDISKDYRFHSLEGNPLRGKGINQLPSLEEVMDRFPNKGFVLNPKVDNDEFLEELVKILKLYEEKGTLDLRVTSMWGSDKAWKYLKNKFPHIKSRLSHMSVSLACKAAYKRLAGFGIFPSECRGFDIVISSDSFRDWNLWGGELGVVQMFHHYGSKIFVLKVDHLSELQKYSSLGFDGVISSTVDVIYRDEKFHP